MPQPEQTRWFLLREHFKMKCEVSTLRSFLVELWIKTEPDFKDFSEAQKEEATKRIDSQIDEVVKARFSQLLEQIEDINPKIAAILDDRGADDKAHPLTVTRSPRLHRRKTLEHGERSILARLDDRLQFISNLSGIGATSDKKSGVSPRRFGEH